MQFVIVNARIKHRKTRVEVEKPGAPIHANVNATMLLILIPV